MIVELSADVNEKKNGVVDVRADSGENLGPVILIQLLYMNFRPRSLPLPFRVSAGLLGIPTCSDKRVNSLLSEPRYCNVHILPEINGKGYLQRSVAIFPCNHNRILSARSVGKWHSRTFCTLGALEQFNFYRICKGKITW